MLVLAAVAALTALSFKPIDHVLVVSVDGLRPELLESNRLAGLPAFARLLRGAHTLDARCDPSNTTTLPNHVGMVTGRLFAGPLGHGWLGNTDPPKPGAGGTIEEMHGSYVPSAFDVASDNGVATAVIAGKTKFALLKQSFGEATGAPDRIGEDDGRDKIGVFRVCGSDSAVAVEALRFLRASVRDHRRSLALVHFAATDAAGHGHSWDLREGSQYTKAARSIDRILEALLLAIESDSALRGKVAVVLTSDHGGGDPPSTHTTVTAPINFTIPFIVWRGTDETPRDMYEINATTRARPPRDQNPAAAEPPPIRNADAGNLALGLLGLGAIEGSTVNARQDLSVESPRGTSTP